MAQAQKLITAKFDAFRTLSALTDFAQDFTAMDLEPVRELQRLTKQLQDRLATCERLLLTAKTGDPFQIGARVRCDRPLWKITGTIESLREPHFVLVKMDHDHYSAEFTRDELEVIEEPRSVSLCRCGQNHTGHRDSDYDAQGNCVNSRR